MILERNAIAKVELKNGAPTVTTLDGENVTNQVKGQALNKAIEHGESTMWYDGASGIWKREGYLTGAQKDQVFEFAKKNAEPTPTVKAQMEENPVMSLIQTAIDKKPKDLFMPELKWKHLVRSVIRGKNVMMTGGAGTGKTYKAQTVAKGLEKPFFFFNLGATQDPRSTLIGNTHFKEGEGTFFNASLFIQAIQTEGAVILLDELSRANPEAWNILMPVLDEGQRYLRLDEQEGSPTIAVANGVCFIATANIGNEFTSTRVMDRALMDRFTIIEVDALDVAGEVTLLQGEYPKLRTDAVKAIAEIADMTRKELKTEAPRIGTAISTRSTLEVAGLMYDGFKLTEAVEVAVLPFYDDEGGMDSERTFVKQVVQKYSHIDNPPVESKTDGNNNDDDLFNIQDDTY
jgi:nitric oxide reductase NorQ protein